MEIKLITFDIAKQFLIKYHYLHSIPKGTLYCFGAYIENQLEGVICFGVHLAKNLWKGLFKTEVKILELSRLAIKPNSKLIASQLISKTCKLVDCDAIISYADTKQGHIGIVYQAANWLYLGTSQKRIEYYLKSNPDLHSRTLFGNKTVEELKDIYGEDLCKREQAYKLRYLYLKTKQAKTNLKAPAEKYVKNLDNVIKKYIYCWTNTVNNKKYVGKTSRPLSHRYTAFNPINGSNSRYFNRAVSKYGKENFKCTILEELPGSTASDELREKESFWIYKLNTLSPNGYNISIPTEENQGNDTRPDARGKQRPKYIIEKILLKWESKSRKFVEGKVVSPCGKLVEFSNLSQFLKDTEGLSLSDRQNFSLLLKGKRHYVRGWRNYKSEEDLIPFSDWEKPKIKYSKEQKENYSQAFKKSRGYLKQLVNPDGEVVTFYNYEDLSGMIKSHTSNIASFYLDPKKKVFKGWSKLNENTSTITLLKRKV